jgi:hypothetical protein
MPITKQASSDLKIKAIKYYYKINNYSNVCKIFECSERSLKRWIWMMDDADDGGWRMLEDDDEMMMIRMMMMMMVRMMMIMYDG